MGRSPFSSAPPPPAPTSPGPGMAPSRQPRPRPALDPAGRRRAPASAPAARPMAAERRTLVVGKGISVQGTVTDAERLVVEGTVEASMIHATELSIAPGGVFKGEAEVEDTEVAGTIDGTLTARGNLIVRSTGKVLGTARCRRLQVEDGGQITGRIEMITEGSSPDTAERPRFRHRLGQRPQRIINLDQKETPPCPSRAGPCSPLIASLPHRRGGLGAPSPPPPWPQRPGPVLLPLPRGRHAGHRHP